MIVLLDMNLSKFSMEIFEKIEFFRKFWPNSKFFEKSKFS